MNWRPARERGATFRFGGGAPLVTLCNFKNIGGGGLLRGPCLPVRTTKVRLPLSLQLSFSSLLAPVKRLVTNGTRPRPRSRWLSNVEAYAVKWTRRIVSDWHNIIQYNTTQHNTTRHNTIQKDSVQDDTIQCNFYSHYILRSLHFVSYTFL